MEHAIDAGVNHPELIQTKNGELVHNDDKVHGISMVLMRFIEGNTFLELDRAPNTIELREVLEQATKINRIDYHPTYLFDSWAIPNIESMFKRVHKFIEPEDRKLIEEVISNAPS